MTRFISHPTRDVPIHMKHNLQFELFDTFNMNNHLNNMRQYTVYAIFVLLMIRLNFVQAVITFKFIMVQYFDKTLSFFVMVGL